MARRRKAGKGRGGIIGTGLFALALLLMYAASGLGLVSWGGGEDVFGFFLAVSALLEEHSRGGCQKPAVLRQDHSKKVSYFRSFS